MYPEAYIEYLAYFHGNRDYFECHEVLEEHWKAEGQQNAVWVGLIQISVSLYHQRRGNHEGAKRMMKSAANRLKTLEDELSTLGLDGPRLIKVLEERLEEIKQHQPYSDLNLPLKDASLLSLCTPYLKKQGALWGTESNMLDENIIHKHKLRDRSEVIEEREFQKKLRAAEDA